MNKLTPTIITIALIIATDTFPVWGSLPGATVLSCPPLFDGFCVLVTFTVFGSVSTVLPALSKILAPIFTVPSVIFVIVWVLSFVIPCHSLSSILNWYKTSSSSVALVILNVMFLLINSSSDTIVGFINALNAVDEIVTLSALSVALAHK